MLPVVGFVTQFNNHLAELWYQQTQLLCVLLHDALGLTLFTNLMSLVLAEQSTMWTDPAPACQTGKLTQVLVLLAEAYLVLHNFCLAFYLTAQHLLTGHLQTCFEVDRLIFCHSWRKRLCLLRLWCLGMERRLVRLGFDKFD
jgi:hypothetical protein